MQDPIMSLRPSNPPTITLDDLQPGDILLSGGSTWLDTLIKLIDEGDYSHATQYVGPVKGNDGTPAHMVVEATQEGVKYQSTDSDMGVQDLVDAYRYVSPEGQHFGDPNWPVQPVLDEAKSYVGAHYAYSELLMGAVAIMASEVPREKHLKEIVRIALDYVDHQFQNWLARHADRVPMTCVQVITSAHWQAASQPANKYGIQVKLDGSRTPPGAASEVGSQARTDSETMRTYQEVRSRIVSAMQTAHPNVSVPEPKQAQAKAAGLVEVAGSDVLPLGTCTPRDMETSPTLTFVGCLKDTRS
jgi:hypothetical protein